MYNSNATEKITAQNSTNQSKVFGLFNESELAYIVDNYRKSNDDPETVINYLKQAEKKIDRARMPDDDKKFIKSAIRLLVKYGNYEKRKHENLIFQSYNPEDIRMELEDEESDKEDITESLNYEIDCLMVDISDMERYNCDGFYDDDIIDYRNAIIEFMEIAEEYELDLGEDRIKLIESVCKI